MAKRETKKTVPKVVKPKKQLSPEEKEEILTKRVNEAFVFVSEQGMSIRNALKMIKLSFETFYEWLANDDKKQTKQLAYARAVNARQELILEDCLDIADDRENDTIKIFKDGKWVEIENKEWVSRSKLRVHTRMQYLAMTNPRKYGTKLELSGDKENPISINVVNLGTGINPENETTD